ncbi:MAG: branched-chain amino acid ABC transporter permease [Desulfosarcina sp.]|nr:branched-chain amino acid ABC transporter permease [Desulfosarcina sp.]
MTFTFLMQNLINALQWGSFYALIAMGYSMVYSILMLFNFAHGDIFMVGAYIGLGVSLGLLSLFGTGAAAILPGWVLLVLTILISMFLTAFVGIIVERVGYRPLREAPRASAAITGLMIGIMLETGNILFLGGQRFKFPQLHQFIAHTKWGMAMRAMAYDYVVVPLVGVPMNTIAAMTFAIGSALAAAAGILFGLAYPVLDPYMGVSFGWKAFVAAILGGRGSIMGACLAGFMLGFIEIMTVPAIQIMNRLFSLNIGSNLRDLIAYSIVLVILVFRPHGLFGQAYSSKLRL